MFLSEFDVASSQFIHLLLERNYVTDVIIGNALGLFCSFLAVILFSKPQVASIFLRLIFSLLCSILCRAALLLSLLGLLGSISLERCGMDPLVYLLTKQSPLYAQLFVFTHFCYIAPHVEILQ